MPTGELRSITVFTCSGDPAPPPEPPNPPPSDPPPSDAQWDILVSETAAGSIRRVASDGSVSSVFFAGVDQPRGIVVEADGQVVVVELSGNLRRISADGTSSSVFFTGLLGPSGVAITPNGDLVVTEDVGGRVLLIAADGSFSSVVTGSIKSEDVEVGGDGNFIVLNENDKGRLGRLTPSGDATVLFDELGGIIDLAIEAAGDIVVAQEAGNVFRIARDWSGLVALGEGFGAVEGIAVTPPGDILVAGFSSGQLWRLPADGGALYVTV